jgi:hypothetical protein
VVPRSSCVLDNDPARVGIGDSRFGNLSSDRHNSQALSKILAVWLESGNRHHDTKQAIELGEDTVRSRVGR